MKKGWIIGGVAVVALCLVVGKKLMTPKQFAQGVSDPVVVAENPEIRDIELTSGLVGSVEPEDVVYVYPKAGGDVTAVNVQAGDTVKAGQLLCVIDTKQVESAKSSLDSAQLALRQAQEELSRQQVLYAGGGISEQAYQQYQDQVQSAQIQYNNAKTNYDNQVSYSQVTAPISGTVELCDVKVYDTVNSGNLLCVISGEGAKVVSFSVTERIRGNLNPGDQIRVEKDGKEYTGIIYEVSTMTDSTTGLFPVKARIDESLEDGSLPTGSSVKLYVVAQSADQVLSVPLDSVYYEGGNSYVYTYDPSSSTLHKIQVETGLNNSDYIEIDSGLTTDDLVLTTWSSELNEGTKVRLKGSTETQNASDGDMAGQGAPDANGQNTESAPDTTDQGAPEAQNADGTPGEQNEQDVSSEKSGQ